MNGNHATNKQTGNTLTAEEWNALAADVNELGQGGGSGNSQGGGTSNVTITDDTVSDPSAGVSIATEVSQVGTVKVFELTKKKKGVNTTVVSENNINFEPRESTVDGGVETKGGNIAFKPGDDIEFCSHHRVPSSQDEVNIKVIDGEDHPVKLQIQAGSLTLTAKNRNLTKNKDANGNDVSGTTDSDYLYGSDDNGGVFDINVTKEYKVNRGAGSKKSGKGYLKVRAQAIDLRCEDHGGIALQPKGSDGQGNMNKIKFEHGGGDGLEFGTFNTEKTSIFTNEYRFNKDGKILLATRQTQASDKIDLNDSTTSLKYVKQADDFYDIIYEGESGSEFYNYDPTNAADTSVTWGDLVKLVAWMKSHNQGPWQA